MDSVSFLKDMYGKFGCSAPNLHCVLGSGLSDALEKAKLSDQWSEIGEIAFKEIPNFSSATVEGHPGKYRIFKNKKGFVVSLQLGRLHGYEGLEPAKVAQSVTQICAAGTKKFLLTNAAGGLNKNYHPGSLMIIDDHINFTGRNPLVGPNPKDSKGKALGPRFPDLSAVYDKKTSALLEKVLQKSFDVHHGTYVGVLGPSFETPAEVKLFSSWGMGAVGMSTVWEAIALKHRGAEITGLSFISNYGCGLVDSSALDHNDVLNQGKQSAEKLINSLFSFFEELI